MDLQKELLESDRNQSHKRSLGASFASMALHGLLVAGIVYAGAQKVTHKVDPEKPINAFLTHGAAPPPPPPPPPPPAKSSGVPRQSTPTPKTVEIPQPMTSSTLTPPVEIPDELPATQSVVPAATQNLPSSGDELPGVEGGVEGGVVGGEIGGVQGGELGGVAGGEVGGEVGGKIGGVVGGQLGGTGTGTEGTGTGGDEAPDGPLRVGGNVKAPVVVDRAEPGYTEPARKARIAGTVVVEAIIDKQGNVDHVKVIKGLPAGLSEEAEQAVRKWKFRPGTLNGEPVATIFNLTVTFKLN